MSSLPADARQAIRDARDRAARAKLKTDVRGRATGYAGVRANLPDACFDAAKGDPLLALSYAADAVVMRRDAR